MGLWTLIVEYRGGTYIRQSTAPSLDDAMGNICKDSEDRFLVSLLDPDLYGPVAITGIKNTWSVSGLCDDEPVFAHIIRTDNDA